MQIKHTGFQISRRNILIQWTYPHLFLKTQIRGLCKRLFITYIKAVPSGTAHSASRCKKRAHALSQITCMSTREEPSSSCSSKRRPTAFACCQEPRQKDSGLLGRTFLYDQRTERSSGHPGNRRWPSSLVRNSDIQSLSTTSLKSKNGKRPSLFNTVEPTNAFATT